MELIDYQNLRKEQAELRKQGRYLGIGVSTYVEICGFGPYESSTVRVEPSGAVSIFTGISPHGQGQETTFAQLAADYIGADFDSVVVHHGDTANTPQGNGTMGSRGLAVGGAALVRSLNKIDEKAKQIAAHILEASEADIELSGGKYQVKGVPTKSLTLGDIAAKAYSGDLPDGIEPGLETTDFFKTRPSPLAATSAWSKSSRRPASRSCCATSRSTTAATSSARCSSLARSTAASPRASARRSARSCATTTAANC